MASPGPGSNVATGTADGWNSTGDKLFFSSALPFLAASPTHLVNLLLIDKLTKQVN